MSMSVVPVSLRKGKAVVVPGRVELPTSTLSVWRSNQLSYRTVFITSVVEASDDTFTLSSHQMIKTSVSPMRADHVRLASL